MHIFLLAVAGLGLSVSRDASDPDAGLDRSDTVDALDSDDDMPDSDDDDGSDGDSEEWSDDIHGPPPSAALAGSPRAGGTDCSETDLPAFPHLKLVCDEFFAPVRDMYNAWSPDEIAKAVDFTAMAEGTGASGAQMSFIQNLYIVKSVKGEEFDLLTYNKHALLRSYKEHMMQNPHTMMVRQFMMLKQIDTPKPQYWLVINNWLPIKAQQVYDLKGSSSGREAKIEHRAKGDMKDNDWRGAKQAIRLTDHDLAPIWDQVVADSKWLEKERLLDYSLIVGVTTAQGTQCRRAGQAVDADERKLPECETPACAGSICVEAGLTSRGWSGPQETAWSRLGAAICQQSGSVQPANRLPSASDGSVGHTCTFTARKSGQAGQVAVTSYCYGIIDMLTRWSNKKRAERAFKKGLGQTDPSVQQPPKYAKRFRAFLKRQFKGGYTSFEPSPRECCQIPQPGPRHCNGKPVSVNVDSADYCLPAGGEECAGTLKRQHSGTLTAPPSSRDWRTRAPGPRRPVVAEPVGVAEPVVVPKPGIRIDTSDASVDPGKLVREEPQEALNIGTESGAEQSGEKSGEKAPIADAPSCNAVYFLLAGAALLIVAGVSLRMWMNRGPASEASAPLVSDAPGPAPRRDARHSVAFALAPEAQTRDAHAVRGRQASAASVGFALQEDDVPARDGRRDTDASCAFNLLDETGRAADAPGIQRSETDASEQFGFSVEETPHGGVGREGSVGFIVSDETARAADRRRQPSVGFGIREDRRDTDASCQFDFKDDD